jgi:DNA-binding transcriptional MerR regulator
LAGVTVKTLHHYDRLGLLKPARTTGGYRVYSTADLSRLEQIVALKALGLSLKDIRRLLERDALPLRSTSVTQAADGGIRHRARHEFHQ